ncbi:STAS/SEC14 domain-containing protein [Oceanobacter mangrovi]|uniref:STAS/SEC14 domain-containing protein n=1 Tax=Oceanobacter mangrovi TaxID=2862510 RepID=UPI001C8D2DB8|nr:STAS/SEC14 domain-containing protein [Oceanobacter mangrovi]
MFEIAKVGDKRLDMVMSGKLDKATMEQALDQYVALSADIEHGQLLFDIVEFHLPSFDAFWLKFSRMSELLAVVKHFERAAVLSDESWLKTISELEGKLFPGLEIKGFNRADKAAAISWLEG